MLRLKGMESPHLLDEPLKKMPQVTVSEVNNIRTKKNVEDEPGRILKTACSGSGETVSANKL